MVLLVASATVCCLTNLLVYLILTLSTRSVYNRGRRVKLVLRYQLMRNQALTGFLTTAIVIYPLKVINLNLIHTSVKNDFEIVFELGLKWIPQLSRYSFYATNWGMHTFFAFENGISFNEDSRNKMHLPYWTFDFQEHSTQNQISVKKALKKLFWESFFFRKIFIFGLGFSLYCLGYLNQFYLHLPRWSRPLPRWPLIIF